MKHYLRCYCNYKQDNWKALLFMIQYVYNSASHAFIELSSFEVVFEIKTDFQFDWDDDKCSNVLAARNRIQLLWNERDKFIQRFDNAQIAQTRAHNKKIILRNFQIEDQIMLFTKNLKDVRLKKKLFYKFTNSFKVINVVNAQTYRLKLSKQWRIHSVFHVSLLKLYHKNSSVVASNEMIFVSEDEKWKVENILKNKRKWKKFYYLVRWKSFFFCEDSWIFKHYLTNAQKLLKQYYKRETSNIVVFKTKKFRLRIDKSDLSKSEWTALLKHECNVDYALHWLKIM